MSFKASLATYRCLWDGWWLLLQLKWWTTRCNTIPCIAGDIYSTIVHSLLSLFTHIIL